MRPLVYIWKMVYATEVINMHLEKPDPNNANTWDYVLDPEDIEFLKFWLKKEKERTIYKMNSKGEMVCVK